MEQQIRQTSHINDSAELQEDTQEPSTTRPTVSEDTEVPSPQETAQHEHGTATPPQLDEDLSLSLSPGLSTSS
jgi:hypothetical protein